MNNKELNAYMQFREKGMNSSFGNPGMTYFQTEHDSSVAKSIYLYLTNKSDEIVSSDVLEKAIDFANSKNTSAISVGYGIVINFDAGSIVFDAETPVNDIITRNDRIVATKSDYNVSAWYQSSESNFCKEIDLTKEESNFRFDKERMNELGLYFQDYLGKSYDKAFGSGKKK